MYFSYFFNYPNYGKTWVLVFSFVVEHVFECNIFIQFIKEICDPPKSLKTTTF